MTKDEALAFLRLHQPLPSDADLGRDTLAQFDKVRKYFASCPDADSISWLLNSFGDGSGFGVYQLVEDAILAHEKEDVLPHLVAVLGSPQPGVQYWCARISEYYDDSRLIAPLTKLLHSPSEDIREAASASLEKYNVR